MILNFRDKIINLNKQTALMGIVELDPAGKTGADEIRSVVSDYLESGACSVELGVTRLAEDGTPLEIDYEKEGEIITKAIEAVREVSPDVLVAVYTSSPLVMAMAVSAGCELIIDPMALRAPGAIETAAKLKVNVCLCFDPRNDFKEEDNVDVCGAIAEFFYERVDTCTNSGIERERIMLDPSLGIDVDLEYRLKLQGRLKSFSSFALPMTCAVPKVFPREDEFMSNNMSVAVAFVLYLEDQGFNLIRTKYVYDLALALDTRHSLMHSARPFRLKSAIGRTLKAIKKKRLAPRRIDVPPRD